MSEQKKYDWEIEYEQAMREYEDQQEREEEVDRIKRTRDAMGSFEIGVDAVIISTLF